MTAAALLTSFDEYRDRMIAISDTARARLSLAPPQETGSLDLARTRMARVLTAYHLFAQRELFQPSMALAGPADRDRIAGVERECAELAQDFRAFARNCAARPVLERWTSYRAEALTMMERVRRHLSKAETEARWCQAQRTKQPSRTGGPVPRAA